MRSADTVARENSRAEERGSLLADGAAVLLGAVMMIWPAFYNGFPLLYPDSMTYLGDGGVVARKIFLHQSSNYYGMRSLFYSLGILPLHSNVTAWPVVVFQAILTAFVLWLVVRAMVSRRIVAAYLALVGALSLLTSLSWYVSIVLPDITGPLVYLAFFLLVFARESLSRIERMLVYGIACWAVTCHATHMMVAAGLCALLVGVMVAQRRPVRQIVRPVGEMGAILGIAVVVQLSLYGYLYGVPSLNGERPPYLMARIVADGTGRKFLEQHCGAERWVLCGRRQNLAGDADHFLWDSDGGWGGAPAVEQRELRREEMPFVLATIRAYPLEQFGKSAAAFWQQLQTFGIEDLDPSSWVVGQFDEVLPGARAHYLAGRQARNALHIEGFTAFQIWAVRSALVLLLVFPPLVWRRMSSRMVGLSVVVAFVVFANALVTGTMSMVDERYGSRVIWMVPLLIGLLGLEWFEARGGSSQRVNAEVGAGRIAQHQ